jgi:hypothetical protein
MEFADILADKERLKVIHLPETQAQSGIAGGDFGLLGDSEAGLKNGLLEEAALQAQPDVAEAALQGGMAVGDAEVVAGGVSWAWK